MLPSPAHRQRPASDRGHPPTSARENFDGLFGINGVNKNLEFLHNNVLSRASVDAFKDGRCLFD